MWKWIGWALGALKGLFDVVRKQRREAEAALAEQRRRAEAATEQLEQDIQKDVSNVECPDLDESATSNDPLGVSRWNHGR